MCQATLSILNILCMPQAPPLGALQSPIAGGVEGQRTHSRIRVTKSRGLSLVRAHLFHQVVLL